MHAGKENVLGVLVDAIDYQSAVSKIVSSAKTGRALSVTALAVHGLMTGVLDSEHRHRLNQLDLVVPDGQPVRWALNLLHRAALADRVYGPTLMLMICREAEREGLSVYLYGGTEPLIAALIGRLQTSFPRLVIAGSRPSRFRRMSVEEKEKDVEAIRASGARITFVGLGCPRQEIWVYENRGSLSMPLVAVGAAFAFHAGILPQAPAFLQKAGFEWLFRLATEPGRLWRRYVILNPLYLMLLTLQALRIKQFDPLHTTPPDEELRYG